MWVFYYDVTSLSPAASLIEPAGWLGIITSVLILTIGTFLPFFLKGE